MFEKKRGDALIRSLVRVHARQLASRIHGFFRRRMHLFFVFVFRFARRLVTRGSAAASGFNAHRVVLDTGFGGVGGLGNH